MSGCTCWPGSYKPTDACHIKQTMVLGVKQVWHCSLILEIGKDCVGQRVPPHRDVLLSLVICVNNPFHVIRVGCINQGLESPQHEKGPNDRGMASGGVGKPNILVSAVASMSTVHDLDIGNAHVPWVGPTHDRTDAVTEIQTSSAQYHQYARVRQHPNHKLGLAKRSELLVVFVELTVVAVQFDADGLATSWRQTQF